MLDYHEHAILADQRFYEALRLLLMHTELSEDLIRCFDRVWTCGRYHERALGGRGIRLAAPFGRTTSWRIRTRLELRGIVATWLGSMMPQPWRNAPSADGEVTP